MRAKCLYISVLALFFAMAGIWIACDLHAQEKQTPQQQIQQLQINYDAALKQIGELSVLNKRMSEQYIQLQNAFNGFASDIQKTTTLAGLDSVKTKWGLVK